MDMKASEILIKKIEEFEGFSNTSYRCPAGVWTCGFGHTKGVDSMTRCTRGEAEQWLREDLAPCEAYVNSVPEIDTQGKFDACVDFCFNLGIGKFKGSTLLKKIKAGASAAEIQAEFRRWVLADGKKLAGLVKRREWEAGRWVS